MHHDHLPGEETMEPKGKLNDREPAHRERENPGGPVFAVCGQTCGQEVLDRIKVPEFVPGMGLFER